MYCIQMNNNVGRQIIIQKVSLTCCNINGYSCIAIPLHIQAAIAGERQHLNWLLINNGPGPIVSQILFQPLHKLLASCLLFIRPVASPPSPRETSSVFSILFVSCCRLISRFQWICEAPALSNCWLPPCVSVWLCSLLPYSIFEKYLINDRKTAAKND